MTRARNCNLLPPERGKVVAFSDRMGVRQRTLIPTWLASLANLPLAGGGKKKRRD